MFCLFDKETIDFFQLFASSFFLGCECVYMESESLYLQHPAQLVRQMQGFTVDSVHSKSSYVPGMVRIHGPVISVFVFVVVI